MKHNYFTALSLLFDTIPQHPDVFTALSLLFDTIPQHPDVLVSTGQVF
jgi:hypothetical protein